MLDLLEGGIKGRGGGGGAGMHRVAGDAPPRNQLRKAEAKFCIVPFVVA